MKLPLFLLLCFAIFAHTSFAQSYTCDLIAPASPADQLVAAFQDGNCLEEIADIDSAKKLVQILDLDVLKYFDLTGLYDDESKQSDYKKTKEYKDNLAQLTSIKNEKLKKCFYSVLTTNLGKFSFSVKGFKFDMDKLSTPGGLTGAPPPPGTIFYTLDVSKLPFSVTSGTDQNIVLFTDPEKGMNIDRNKDSTMTIVLFSLGDVAAKEYSYFNGQCHCNRNAKEEVIKTKFDRVLIFNIKTNEVYFDERMTKLLQNKSRSF